MAITLDEINQTLLEQNKSLDITAKSLVKFIEGEKGRRGDELEEKLDAAREKKRAVTRAPQPQGFKAGFKEGLGDATGFSSIARWVSSALAGAFGGATLATVGGLVGKYLARGAVWGSAALLIGKFGTQLVEKVFESINLDDVTLGSEDGKLLSAAFGDALRNGAIAMIFGKKLAISTFFGTLIGNAISSVFDVDDKTKLTAFGFELPLTAADFVDFGATIGAFFAPALILSSIRSSLGGAAAGATVGRGKDGRFTKLKPGFAKSFARSFRPRLGWGFAIAGVGNILGAAIGGAMDSPEVGQNIAMAANFIALGAMFGPGGALAAAGIAAAIGIGSWLIGWMKGQYQKNVDAMEKKINDDTAEMDRLRQEGKFNEAADSALKAMAENNRLAQIKSVGAAAQSNAYLGESLADIGFRTGNENMYRGGLKKQFKGVAQLPGLSEKERIEKLAEIANKFSRTRGGMDIDVAVAQLSSSIGIGAARSQIPGGIFSIAKAIETAAMSRDDYIGSQKIDTKFFDQFMKSNGFMRPRTLDIQSLMPPVIEDFSFLGPTRSHPSALAISQDDNSSTTYGSVTYQQSTPTQDLLRGGSSGFSIIGQVPLLS